VADAWAVSQISAFYQLLISTIFFFFLVKCMVAADRWVVPSYVPWLGAFYTWLLVCSALRELHW
jgi:hypothetical protein